VRTDGVPSACSAAGTVIAHKDPRTAQGDIAPWLASQTDLLADDWEEVPDAHGAA